MTGSSCPVPLKSDTKISVHLGLLFLYIHLKLLQKNKKGIPQSCHKNKEKMKKLEVMTLWSVISGNQPEM